mgnify:CR=1 FL=1
MRGRMVVYAVIVALVLVTAPTAVGPVMGGMYLIEEL